MAEKHAWWYFSGAYLTAADAIDRSDTADLERALKGLDVDARGKDNITLMWYAITRKQYGAVSTLVRMGSNVEQQVVEGLGTPLLAALRTKDDGLLRAMLDGGLSPNFQDSDGTSLLQQVIEWKGDPFPAVKLLLSRGADINHRDHIGDAPITGAIIASRPDIAMYLIEHGADVNVQAVNGATLAYGVQVSINHLQPNAPQAKISNYTLDDKGQPVVTETTPPPPGLTPEGQKLLGEYEQLRDMMIARGVKFPPETPAQVRERMSAASGNASDKRAR
ncbi:Ankyrin [Burkholderia sp. H160]|nr:Ankyrin [Burkholderia sp. H160]